MLLWNDPDEPCGDDLRFDPGWLRRMLPMAWRRLPRLREAQVSPRRSWSGLYEMTRDHHPVLGKVPGVEGLYLANGFSGHGVMHSPATGRLLAELIVHGEARLMDIAPLRPERFSEGEPMEDIGVL
jgi:sarcosine oxidase subunit beta